MIVVGELINASRKKMGEAIRTKDAGYIGKIAQEQRDAGADYIDVNAGIFVEEEPDYLKWLVKVVQEATQAPCSIDSPNPKAIMASLEVHREDMAPMLNSISLEQARYKALLPIVAGTNMKIVALCMSDEGMPETAKQRLEIAEKLINSLTKENVPIGNIYVDPLVQPVSTNQRFGIEFLNAVKEIMEEFPGVHTMCGLSNISFGLPNRMYLNRMFAVMAIANGLDGLIVNPLDRQMMTNLTAAQTLAGRDKFCMQYLTAHRQGRFDP